MHKLTHTKSLLFKSLLVAVFGAFFFVQAQSSFIYCAYDSDFASGSSSSVHGAGTHISDAKASLASHNNLKLNKRYQAVAAHAIIPAPVFVPVYFTIVNTRWYTPSVPSHVYFLYTKPLRGPPVV